MNDQIGNLTLSVGMNTSLASNRYREPFRSTEFKNGYYSIPVPIYIENDFSVSAWVNLTVNKQYNVLASFAGKEGKDMIWIGFKHLQFHVELSITSNETLKMTATTPLQKDFWTFVTFVLKNSIGFMYLNGSLNSKVHLAVPNREQIERTENFIGKDSFDSNLYFAEAIYKNLKIYKGALTDLEVKNQFDRDGKLKPLFVLIFIKLNCWFFKNVNKTNLNLNSPN